MNIEQGPYCSTGIENRERIAALAARCEAMVKIIEDLTQAMTEMRIKQAWMSGVFAAIGALVGGSISNVMQLFGK